MKKGYSEEWIHQRLLAIRIRNELTDEWKNRGVQKGKEYAILTDEISRAWSGMTTGQYKRLKGLTKENLRDNMTAITKVNIVKLADGNFLKAVHHIGETEYPDIEVQERLVDAIAAKMADPEFTKGCEVFVLPNLYGDRTAKLEKALDICCNTEKKLVVTTDKDGATSEEFTTYLLDTLKAL